MNTIKAPLYTTSEVARILDCSRQYIHKLVTQGKIKRAATGTQVIYFEQSEVQRLMEGKCC